MPRRHRPSVLTLSGSDPSGGAGLEADLKVFHQHGVFGMAIPTLLTVQNAEHVRKVRFLDPDFFADQWRMVFESKRPGAIKIGALGSQDMVRRVAALLTRPEARGIPVVLDPVLGSASGASLLEPGALADLQKRLFPRCRVITPNALEFATLAKIRELPANPRSALAEFGAGKKFAILLKGGHLQGRDCIDFLQDGTIVPLKGRRLERALHGTGCALASSIAANLARGFSLRKSCVRAKAYVARALSSSLRRGEAELDFGVKA